MCPPGPILFISDRIRKAFPCEDIPAWILNLDEDLLCKHRSCWHAPNIIELVTRHWKDQSYNPAWQPLPEPKPKRSGTLWSDSHEDPNDYARGWEDGSVPLTGPTLEECLTGPPPTPHPPRTDSRVVIYTTSAGFNNAVYSSILSGGDYDY
ncbi:hypothetical protein FRC08_015714 [Ceratobasidium sp. 394]|nr:hypothetical protein FRC08_015714 [Ceratobasidium sp. 394]